MDAPLWPGCDGFAPEHLLSFRLSLPWQTDPERLASVYGRVLDRLASIPGVDGVALTDRLPLDGDTQSGDVEIAGRDAPGLPHGSQIGQRAVSAGYHELIGVPLRSGRYLQPSDSNARRALINQAAARLYFNGENVLGHRIGLRNSKPTPSRTNLYEIVGVVADLPDKLRSNDPEPAMYVPFNRAFWPLATFLAKTRVPIAQSVRREVASVDPSLAVEQVQTIDDYLSTRKRTPRLEAWLVGMFACIAMSLAGIGIYGLVAGSVEDRRKEIGIRMALGAEPGVIVRETLLRLAWHAALGTALGAAMAGLIARGIASHLYNVGTGDARAYAAAITVLLCVAICAAWWPARQASRIDPANVLRRE